VVDGRSWSEFAKVHHAELWPERRTEVPRKTPESIGLFEDWKTLDATAGGRHQ
jgi:hypothetical protein